MARQDPSLSIPTKKSKSEAWIDWMRVLDRSVGKKAARTLFLKAWEKRGTSTANDANLRKFLNKYDIELSADGFFEELEYKATDIGSWIGNTLKMGRYAGYAVAGGAFFLVMLVGFNIARKPIESAKALTALRGGGGKGGMK